MRSCLISLFVLVLTSPVTRAGAQTMLGRPCTLTERPSLDRVDHSLFDQLLHKYVDERCLVDYAAWQATPADLRALDDYLALVGCVDLAKPATQNARLAYWLNVYNAVTIRGILLFYPTTSIRRHVSFLGGFHFWKDLLIWVDRRLYSLDDIEHQILRKMGEPRIHFGAVCASRGCPPLQNRAFTPQTVIEQLNENAQLFFAQPGSFQADVEHRTVHVSELIKWYGSDFAPTPPEQIQLLKPFFPHPETLGWMAGHGVKVKYLRYDWGLNDQHPPPPTLRDRLSPWNW